MGNSIGVLKYVKETSAVINKCFTRNKKNLGEMNDLATCRICLQSDGTLIEPCACKGSVAFIHSDCLEKWIKVKKNSTFCELCKTNYKLNSKFYLKMSFRSFFDGESFCGNLCTFLLLFLFYLLFIMIVYLSKPFLCFENSEAWTSTTQPINKDAASTSISFMNKFLLHLVHFLAISFLFCFVLFWLGLSLLLAIPFFLRSTIMDHL